MARKTIITVIVLLGILALLFWYQQSREEDNSSENTELSVSVFNTTKNADATTVTASPEDNLTYTLTVRNTGDETISGYVVETNISDLSELAVLTDAQGANYNASTNSLMWTPLDIPVNGSIEKQFTVRVKPTLPTDSDLMMSVTFNNEVIVSVAPAVAANPTPTPSQTPTQTPAQPPYKAPTTGPSMWFAFILAVTFTLGVLLFRASKRISAE